MLRFFMLLSLCCMIVYAPEILSTVSAPYALTAPSRSLLRIALCCDPADADAMHTLINTYQKRHPSVHLRVTRISQDQIGSMQPPYPDVILCCGIPDASLPANFFLTDEQRLSISGQPVLCAVSQHNTADGTAEQFAAYINEAIIASQPPFQN